MLRSSPGCLDPALDVLNLAYAKLKSSVFTKGCAFPKSVRTAMASNAWWQQTFGGNSCLSVCAHVQKCGPAKGLRLRVTGAQGQGFRV